MPSILNFIKTLPEIATDNIVNDVQYIRKSSVLVSESLQKGADIMQMPNGDIHVTETKVVTYKYHWNKEKNRFERASTGIRARRKRKEKETFNDNDSSTRKIAAENPLLEKIA